MSMERNKRTALNEQIYEEAGEWFLEFRDGEPDIAIRREFDLWVRRSPDHLAAYLEIAAIWNEAPALESPQKSELIALASLEAENIVPLVRRSAPPVVTAKPSIRSRLHSGQGVRAAAILTVAACAAAGLWWLDRSVYSTGIGEQRTIALQDGSRVELNSRSKLKVHYSQDKRSIELLEGQALFSVAKDARRPFVVSSGNASVRAVGTQFDVYRKSTGTVVTVVEGRVAIQGESGSFQPPQLALGKVARQPVLVSAGQQLMVTRSEIKRPVAANVENVTAWTQRQLAFDAASLADVAEEFNRYNERRLVIKDSGDFKFRISGVFSSSDPAGLIRFLRGRPDIHVAESPAEIVIERIEKTPHERKPYLN